MANANNKDRRAQRLRTRIKKVANGRPRLSVFRSAKNISAQIIDDVSGRTLAAASSLEKDVAPGAKSEEAARIGALIAERARQAGVTAVVFDRGAYLYHGRVKALAEAARAGGLEF
jgi:large subunit ribosomal protein L18